MDAEERELMTRFLKGNIDVLDWKPYDMPGMDVKVTYHKLHIGPNHKPMKQKPRRTSPKKAKAVEKEFEKLLKVGTIIEVKFLD